MHLWDRERVHYSQLNINYVWNPTGLGTTPLECRPTKTNSLSRHSKESSRSLHTAQMSSPQKEHSCIRNKVFSPTVTFILGISTYAVSSFVRQNVRIMATDGEALVNFVLAVYSFRKDGNIFELDFVHCFREHKSERSNLTEECALNSCSHSFCSFQYVQCQIIPLSCADRALSEHCPISKKKYRVNGILELEFSGPLLKFSTWSFIYNEHSGVFL